MARPAKSEKRDRQLNLKLTMRELDWVKRRAGTAGLRVVEFARRELLCDRPVRARPEVRPGQLDALFMAQVSRIGNNLNQIARRLHQLHMPEPATLHAVLREIRDIIRKSSEK